MVQFIGNYFDEDTATDPLMPKAFVVPSQSGSTATLSLTVRDEYLKVTDIEKRTKQGNAAWSSWTDLTGGSGTIGVDKDLTRSQTVTIEEKHNSEIGIRIEWTDEESVSRYTYFSQTFDLDTIPSVVCGLSLTLSTVDLAWIGDEDLASIKYKTSTSAMPVDVTGGTSADGRTGSEEDLGTLTLNQIMYVRVRGYTGAGATGTESAEDWLGTIRRDSTLMPTIQVIATQSGTTGTLTLNIEDPDSKMNATSFEEGLSPDADPANWTDYDNSDPYGTSVNATIAEKHGAVIHWGVRYDVGDGNTWITGSHTFDIDLIPSVTGRLDLSGTYNRSVRLMWEGDEDLASIKYLAEKLNVRVRGYSGAGATGTASAEDILLEITYTQSEIPTVKAIPSQSGNDATVTLVVANPNETLLATAFERTSPTVGYTVDADPANWNVYDAIPPLTYTKTYTNLIESKHEVAIWWAVKYDDGLGVWITGQCTFDSDLVAEMQSVQLNYDTDNTINVVVQGDEDCANIYVNVSVDGVPAISDPTNTVYDGTVSGNQGSMSLTDTATMGQTIVVRAAGYNGAGTPVRGPVSEYKFIRGDTPKVPIHVETDPDQSGATGQFNITIKDPQLVLTNIQWKTKAGAGDWTASWSSTSWDYTDGKTPGASGSESIARRKDVALQLKHNSEVKILVTYADGDGVSRTQEYHHAFDLDEQAEIQSIEINIEDNGSVWAAVVGDEDTANIYLTCSIDAEPSAPTTSVYDATVSGREGYVDTTKDATDFEHVAWVKVGAADSGGTMGPIIEAKVRRPGGEVAKTLRISALGAVKYYNSNYELHSQAGYIHPGTAHASQVASGVVALTLPKGVTITKSSCRMYRLNSSSGVSYQLSWSSDTGAETYLAGGAHASTLWVTDSDTISHVVNDAYHYSFRIVMQADTTNDNARCAWFEVEYTSADIDETI
jgi:hypothetical protein